MFWTRLAIFFDKIDGFSSLYHSGREAMEKRIVALFD